MSKDNARLALKMAIKRKVGHNPPSGKITDIAQLYYEWLESKSENEEQQL